MLVEIKRFCFHNVVTIGILEINSIPTLITLERPWKENKAKISCIPEGQYLCKRVVSPHFGETFEVTNVPERSYILFHKGNFVEDSKGCIILGNSFGTGDVPFVKESKKAFEIFMETFRNKKEFQLNIKRVN